VEATFYAWVTALIAWRLFPRRIDTIVACWLSISMLNELTIDAAWVEKIFLADYAGFFATGLMIYELYRGRRDAVVQCLLALSVGTAVFQAVHNLGWLRNETGNAFDDWIVAGICLVSVLIVVLATRIRRLPLPGGAVIAIGGMTYPLYLLHQQLGYVVFERIGPGAHPAALSGIIVAAIAGLSWLIWRYIERPSQRWTRQTLTGLADRWSRPVKPKATSSAI
jgi:peptidoglycan/LPS O-acetylase OafA/YrhL